MMSPRDVPTAHLDPWTTTVLEGRTYLFGYALVHPTRGGLSWLRSSPVVEWRVPETSAVTASGRLYALGRRLEPCDLDEEGQVAFRLLSRLEVPSDWASQWDAVWLMARKMARHLDVPPPARDDHAACVGFLETHRSAYELLRNLRPSADLH